MRIVLVTVGNCLTTILRCFFQDVMRIIDHDRKLRHFMSTKTEDRSSILEQAIYKRQNKRMTNLLGNLKVEASKYEEIFSKIRQVGVNNSYSSHISNEPLCIQAKFLRNLFSNTSLSIWYANSIWLK